MAKIERFLSCCPVLFKAVLAKNVLMSVRRKTSVILQYCDYCYMDIASPNIAITIILLPIVKFSP